MKIIQSTFSQAIGTLFCLSVISCGNSGSKTETEETTGHRYHDDTAAVTDTFIQSDGDPRYQGIQGPQPVDSVRVKKPVQNRTEKDGEPDRER